MFKFIAFVTIFGLAAAGSLDSDSLADFKIIENDITPEGAFRYAFQTANGIEVNAAGDANLIGGSYKYVSPEGKPVGLTYTADADGYHPAGELLPTPPPIPADIIRSIEWNLAHPSKDVVEQRRLL